MKGEEKMEKAMLASDYQEGAHPGIMRRLLETNLLQTPGYGADEFSESARRKIREACGAGGGRAFPHRRNAGERRRH